MKHMAKGAAFGAGVLVLAIVPRLARSADHLDAPAVTADPTADINDLYSWIDGSNVVFALTVSPLASSASLFSDKVQYVIHTTHSAKFGIGEAGAAKDIMCTFSGTGAPQTAQCWVGNDAYVKGNADTQAGITSKNAKLKVFAGLRKDPFFFNLDGFHRTVATVEGAASSLTFDASGCPALSAATANALRQQLRTAPNDGTAVDFFKDKLTLAIVVSIDKSLLVSDDAPMLSAWASTNKAQ